MRNKIWEQVGQFLNRLRCENVTRDTAIEVPGYRETQEEMEEQKAYCQGYVDCILLLSGMGLSRQDLSTEEFMKWIRQ